MDRLTKNHKPLFEGDDRKYDLVGQEDCLSEYDYIEIVDSVIDRYGELEDIKEEIGVDLVLLFKALKAKKSGLRYFNKYDAKVNGIEEGWYVKMMMYGWLRVEDFVKGALTKEELENEK